MLYIPNESIRPAFNQAFEQAVFELYTEGDILLLWRNTPCVVCGRNQNVFEEVDVLKALHDGVEIIRRDTGGGTVYHDLGNINYTIITDAEGISVDYDKMLGLAVNALRSMGISAQKNRTCDIAIDGMKISGSAQRQTKNRVLHHGTMLYSTDLTALEKFSKKVDGVSSRAIESNRTNVTNISSHVRFSSAKCFMDRFAEAILQGGTVSQPTCEMLQLAEQLCRDKYMTWEWTYGKNPPFTCCREHDGIRIEYSAKRGVITQFNLESEYSSSDGTEFIGAKLESDTIYDICTRVFDGKHAEILYKIIFGELK